MNVTIEEAKQKWCPQIRFQIGPNDETWQNRAFNNRGEVFDPTACMCVAKDCMMFKSAGFEMREVWDDFTQTPEYEEVAIFKCGLSR